MGVVVEVKANDNSTSGGTGKEVTGITINAGDLISIFCDFDRKWSVLDGNTDFLVNANGKLNQNVTLTNGQVFTVGSLVGSFDDGDTFFPIGLFTQIVALTELPNPVLKLYCADSDKLNNSGSIFAHVKVSS